MTMDIYSHLSKENAKNLFHIPYPFSFFRFFHTVLLYYKIGFFQIKSYKDTVVIGFLLCLEMLIFKFAPLFAPPIVLLVQFRRMILLFLRSLLRGDYIYPWSLIKWNDLGGTGVPCMVFQS
ncbi:Uncharacterised protein [Streptococcus pneumoniae]|nr:Uncharacterised protein [Streptococcus pneumoniae]